MLRRARVAAGETVAVIGAGGGLGIHQLMMAKWARTRVIAVDTRAAKFEATPVAIDGTLYVTGLYNHAWAIDGRTGAVIWPPGSPAPQRSPPRWPNCCKTRRKTRTLTYKAGRNSGRR